MLVVIDPFPTVSAVLHDRIARMASTCLPAATTQFETYAGLVTASNRSHAVARKGHGATLRIQGGSRDHRRCSAKKFGFP